VLGIFDCTLHGRVQNLCSLVWLAVVLVLMRHRHARHAPL